MGNDYGRPKDIVGETRQSFTSLADTAFDVCFENTVTNTRRTPLFCSTLRNTNTNVLTGRS